MSEVDTQFEALHHSDQRLVRTVDSLTDGGWREPSLLPGWSRADVIAHLALNAEGFSRGLEGIDLGVVQPIYESEEARDADIHELARAEVRVIRERLFAGTTRFRKAVEGLTGSQWDEPVHRFPGGPLWPATALTGTRWREVEIHHADLGAGYGHRDWPTDFAVALLDQVTGDQAAAGGDRFSIRATDLGRTWTLGADDPVVEGTAADLGWWLTGRGDASDLNAEDGALPRLDAWRRAPEPEAPVAEPVGIEPDSSA